MNEELGDWLALASGDVPVGEQQRLRAELLAHYEDAVNLYVQQGKSPVEAHRAALADLGDPHETADAARRIYGTRRRARIWPSFGRLPGRMRFNANMMLLVLGLMACLLIPAVLSTANADLTRPTMAALVLQTATLTVALSIPLRFRDLDLSLGVVVMMGVLLTRPTLSPHGIFSSDPAVRGDLPSLLVRAGTIGAGIGLVHGLAAVTLRVPVAAITFVTGLGLATVLSGSAFTHQLALDSPARTEVLGPTLALFAGTVLLACTSALVMGWLSSCETPKGSKSPVSPGSGSPDGARLGRVAMLVTPVVMLLGLINFAPDRFYLVVLAGVLSLLVAVLLRDPRALRIGTNISSQPPHWGRQCINWVPLITFAIVAIDYSSRGRPLHVAPISMLSMLALLGVLALPVVGALLVLEREIRNTAAREWFSARSSIRARQPQIAAARVAALVLCSMAAAITGVLLCVQGMRDNNYVPAASYFILVPLAGLIAGGQHVLGGQKRLLGMVLGALVAAALGVGFNQPTDNLGGGIGILVAALFAILWRRSARSKSVSRQAQPSSTEATTLRGLGVRG